MGRRKNTSQPMVLDVMLAPFTESFQIEASDTTQQWYYANTEEFLPDRGINPLILTPTLSVFDPDSKQVYTPSFGDVKWYYLDDGSWVRITNTQESTESVSYPYVVYADGRIKVNKNVLYDAPVTLLCECPYIDPRTTGVSYTIKQTLDLTTNRDATTFIPTISINQGVTQWYDVIKDASNSQKTFLATVMLGEDNITNTSTIKWYALNKSNGIETLIDATTTVDGVNVPLYPCYVSGQNTSSLVLDAMYAEDITIVARIVKTASPLTLYPSKAISTLRWVDIPMDIIVRSNNSGGIRSDTKVMDFDVIANANGLTLSDAQMQEHLLFNWKRRNQANSSVIDEGWGQTLLLQSDKLKQYVASLVYVEACLLGANEALVDAGEIITDSNPVTGNIEAVYDRIV